MSLLTTLLAAALAGFAFGTAQAPDGNEWQSPERLAFNKELPHAWFFSFTDKESAAKVLPENSTLWLSLNGEWKFNWVANPEERPVDFYKSDYDDTDWGTIPVPSNWNVVGLGQDGSQRYGTPIYVNIDVPFKIEIKPDDWRLGVMRTPPEDWTMYKARNEVGSYRRTFEVPSEWSGNQVFLNFDGVDSFFYLWVNGQYAGFSKNSRNVAQFDITKYLREGENLLAVEVYRNSDGSNLEVQDMFRLPGIFRTVALEAKPHAHVRDIKVTPSLNSMSIETELTGAPAGSSISWTLLENEIYSDDGKAVAMFPDRPACTVIEYPDAKPWSAETPQRYVLVGELKDAQGQTLDIFSTYVGFREVAIREVAAEDDEFGIAGRYFLINGKAVKLRGVNRHETWPTVGHAVTREMMEADIMLMKRANVNHVRDCHYPDDPYWYILCDKYGIYLMDEANIESHHYRYGEASLSHPVEWRAAHLARMREMMAQNYNHPSIVIWSMGNEAGPGINFKYTYDDAKSFDPMRPVQYERNNDYSDIGCRQYPSVSWVENVAGGNADVKYPYHINEFAHSMGNALGNFADYWKWMDSNNRFIGGAIWDWVDQSLYNWTADGTRYLASGGDFGDIPNDGQFVMNGLLFGDREPKPQYWEVKKVYQNFYATLTGDRKILITNRNYFTPDAYDVSWTLLADGREYSSGTFDTGSIAPRSSSEFELPCSSLPEGKECYLNLSFLLKKDLPWAAKGYEACRAQLFLQKQAVPAPDSAKGRALRQKCDGQMRTVRGRGFKAVFDDSLGTLRRLQYRGRDVFVPGYGPMPDFYRAYVNNDSWIFKSWFANGLDRLEHNATLEEVCETEDGELVLRYTILSKAPCATAFKGQSNTNTISLTADETKTDVASFTTCVTWRISKDGSINCCTDFSSDNPGLVVGKLGFVMKVPAAYKNFRYYGRGPGENYSDRCTDAFVGTYGREVCDEVTNYTSPQDMSNHEQVRWAGLYAGRRGVEFVATRNSLRQSDSGLSVMSVSAIPYSARDLTAATHTYQLPAPGDTWLSLDAAVLGLGGASCGPRPEDKDIVHPEGSFGFTIRPARLKE